MKSIKTNIIVLFLSIAFQAFSVNLPSFPFYSSNELYEVNHDQIEFEAGTQIKGINILLENVAGEWGEYCMEDALGDPYDCQQCCVDKWEEFRNDPSYKASYTTCFNYCGGGESLPLGSTLWLLPFIIVYTAVKRVSSKKLEASI